MKITCKNCKQEVDVPMYFYDTKINHQATIMSDSYYVAFTRGKAICPNCGIGINEIFESEISREDMIKLATEGGLTNESIRMEQITKI